jgi:hypothetical protein
MTAGTALTWEGFGSQSSAAIAATWALASGDVRVRKSPGRAAGGVVRILANAAAAPVRHAGSG